MYNMYKQPSAVDVAIDILSIIIAIVITIIVLVKFFQLCKNVASIASLLETLAIEKKQPTQTSTTPMVEETNAETAQTEATKEQEVKKDDDGLNWNAFIIAILCVAFFIAIFYFSMSGKI